MKKRVPYFLAGLFSGVLLGLTVSYWVYRHHNGIEAPRHKGVAQLTHMPDKPGRLSQQRMAPGQKQPDEVHSGHEDHHEEPQDTTALTDSLAVNGLPEDSLLTPGDSVQGPYNDFIIKTEQHIHTRKYPVIPPHSDNDTLGSSPNLDSLLIDDRHTRLEEPDSLSVEFWVSPINYTGFRRHRDRLQLFGISTEESIHIFRMEDGLYMNLRGKNFFLKETTEHQPLQLGPTARGY